jgi:dTDP-4-amino-4,6-dideoxygalactose transaminase
LTSTTGRTFSIACSSTSKGSPPFFSDVTIQRAVHDALGDGLLAVFHEHVDELREQLAAVLRVRQDLALRNNASSRHLWTSSDLDV